MFVKYLCGVLLMCLSMAQTKGFVCQMSLFQNCDYHELVTVSSYQGFIPVNKLNSHCSNQDMALKCAQNQNYLQGCSNEQLLEYNMIKSLHRAICVVFTKEYKDSSNCFQLQEFKDSVEVCNAKFEHPRQDSEYCNYFEEGLMCLSTLHEMVNEPKCEQKHFQLQNVIFRAYVEPLRKSAKCPEPEGFKEPTVLPTATAEAPRTTPQQPSVTTSIMAPTEGATKMARTESLKSQQSQGGNAASSITHKASLIFTVISLVYLYWGNFAVPFSSN